MTHRNHFPNSEALFMIPPNLFMIVGNIVVISLNSKPLAIEKSLCNSKSLNIGTNNSKRQHLNNIGHKFQR